MMSQNALNRVLKAAYTFQTAHTETTQGAVMRKRRFLAVKKVFCLLRSQYLSHGNGGATPAAGDHGPNSQTKILNIPLILSPYQICA